MLRELARRLIFVTLAILPIVKYLLVCTAFSVVAAVGGFLFSFPTVAKISTIAAGIFFSIACGIPLFGLLITKYYYDTE